ncbi:MAG: lipopolysaccharide assembly protein LapB [Burkholderiaceae bacterium]|jgi:lipopolysaccharide biosynthesis regulator YciM
MEFEVWWLLVVPLVFVLGWCAARFDLRQARKTAQTLPSSYFRGVNFLLNEQPDHAIDAFLEVANLNTETAELHFALANLFRKRGEVDRAIRIHESLKGRADLSEHHRLQAVYESGVDYLRAGILDRAEAAFESLRDTPRAAEASRKLLELYEIEKAWDKAIAEAGRLQSLDAPIKLSDIAHFHCELAEVALSDDDSIRAFEALSDALAVHPGSVRATLMMGEIALAHDDRDKAIEYWHASEKQNPWYLPLVGLHLWKAYEAKGAVAEGLAALERYCTDYPSIDLLKVWVDALLQNHGPHEAYARLRMQIRRLPSLLGLDRLLLMQIDSTDDEERRRDLVMMRELMARHTARLARFRCHICGFQAKQFYWQCPGCATWDSIIPRRVEELDFYPIPDKPPVAAHSP